LRKEKKKGRGINTVSLSSLREGRREGREKDYLPFREEKKRKRHVLGNKLQGERAWGKKSVPNSCAGKKKRKREEKKGKKGFSFSHRVNVTKLYVVGKEGGGGKKRCFHHSQLRKAGGKGEEKKKRRRMKREGEKGEKMIKTTDFQHPKKGGEKDSLTT